MPYKGHMVHQLPFPDPVQGLSSYTDLSLIALKLSGEQTGNGAFPAAGLSCQGHKGTLGNEQADFFQDFSVLLIRKPDILQFYVKILQGYCFLPEIRLQLRSCLQLRRRRLQCP